MGSKKATIKKIGTFDDEGMPKDWEFEQKVRLVKKPDGTYTIGGYTNDELLTITEEEKDRIAQEAAAGGGEASGNDARDSAESAQGAPDAAEQAEPGKVPESASEPPKGKTVVLEEVPADYLSFNFDATIVGVAAKKPAKLRTHKEIKLLSPDLDVLQQIDSYLEYDVEVSIKIRKRGSFFASSDSGENADDDEPTQGDLFKRPEPHVGEAGPAVPDVLLNPDDDHTPVDIPVVVNDEGEEVAGEPEQKTKPVCSECGMDLEVNGDDPTQLICVNCGLIHVNTQTEPTVFE